LRFIFIHHFIKKNMNPSLLLIPDRYKAAKLYSQIPDSGAGDLTFARNSNATRVNSAGLIEKVRTNLALYSQDFTNAAWYKELGNSATGNTIANPLDGTVNADTLTATDTNAMNVNQLFTAAATSEHTYSIYLKKNNHDLLQPYIFSGGGFAARIEINLNDGTFTTINGSGATVTSVGNGWYRITLIALISSSAVFTTGALTSSTTGSRSVYVYGAQVETGVATPYIPTTTAAVSVGVTADIPRLDYTGGGCPSLLLEPQRTNLALFSEQLNNVAWGFQGSTVTANAAISPDGFANADAVVETATTDEHNRLISATLTAASYTASVFLKKFNETWCALYLFNGSVGIRHWINLDTLTAGTSAPIGAGITAPLTLTNYGNGWVRASMTFTADASSWSFYIANARSNGGATSYAGNGTSGVYAWGAQVELGSYPTSYIPTLGSSVTRLADAASKTGISSLIGATEGTIYGEFTFTGISPQMHMFVSVAGSFANAVYVQTFSATGISMQVWNGVVNQVAINSSGLTAGQNVKFAAAYKANDFALYVNGVQVGTDTSGSVPSGLSQVEVGNYAEGGSPFNFNSSIKTAALYPVRLSNSELATLTAL
jgi:hypothetical protein